MSKCSGKDLVNESDIPRILNLPLEINGVKINKDAIPEKAEIQEGGHTDVEEAGCKTMKEIFTVRDDSKNEEYTNLNLKTALDSLKARTGVEEYELDIAS